MPASPWTQSATLTWRPTIAFYERRFEFLRYLEKEHRLRGFRVDDNTGLLEAKLGDLSHEVSLGPGRAGGRVMKPTNEWETVERPLLEAIEYVDPPDITTIFLTFQFYVGLEYEFGEALARANSKWFGAIEGANLTIADTAALVDFQSTDQAVKPQVEFGILTKSDLPLRLQRVIGRMRDRGATPLPPDLSTNEAPEVGIFADWSWFLRSSTPRQDFEARFRNLRQEAMSGSVGYMEFLSGSL